MPAGLSSHQLLPHRYAVFVHADHIASIGSTYDGIMSVWLPQSKYRMAAAPMYELYTESYDPGTGLGGVELWLPIADEGGDPAA